MSFKERTRIAIIDGAALYKMIFMEYEYLIFSRDFRVKPYYIIRAEEDNFAHLTGVNYLLSAKKFYEKALDNSLTVEDFNFSKPRMRDEDVKGSVRRKIQVLPKLADIFSYAVQAEENFIKGAVSCSLATADNALTIGFADSKILRPKTLLKGNELNKQRMVDIELILKRNRGSEVFDTVVLGNIEEFKSLFPELF